MKKILALIISVVMLLSVMPFAIFAEEEPANPIKIVDADGNDVATYAALQDAYDAVQEGQKIVITEDITLAKYLVVKSYDKNNLRNIVIEGAVKADGSKVIVTAPLGFTDQVGLYNLTVRNLEIVDTNKGTYDVFMYDPYYLGWVGDFSSPTLVIDNCVITSKAAIFKFKADSNQGGVHNPFIVKIKDSVLTAEGGNDRGVGTATWKGGASVDMTVENSTITLTAGNQTSSNPEFSYIFTHYPINNGATTTSYFNLHVDGNSTLINNSTNTTTPTAGIFYGATGVSNVTVEEGAVLYVNSGASKTQNSFIRGNVNYTDNGAIYKVSATAAKNGVTLPTIGEDVWYVDGKQVTNPYVNASATEDIILTHGAFVAPSFDPIQILEDGEIIGTYAELQDAFDELIDGQKIVLLDDIILAAPLTYKGNYNASDLKDVVIEGATKVTVTCANGFADQVACYNLTVKNLNIVNNGSNDVFKYDPYVNGAWVTDFVSPTVIVDNCNITANLSAVFRFAAQSNGAAFKKNNAFFVTIKDSTVTAGGSAGTSVICVPWNVCASADVSIVNSTVTAAYGNATSGNPETSYIICFNPIKGGVSDYSNTFNLTVDGTSKLVSNLTNTVTPTGGIFNNAGGTSTITLAEGAELYVNNGSGKTQNAFILNTRGNLTVNDNGAVWKVGADTAKAGVTLPTFGEDAWYLGDTPVANPYKDASATGDVVLTHAELADPDLDPSNVAYVMVNGEKVYYSNVRTALAQAPNGSTIVLLRDSSYTGHGSFTSKNLTLDGNNKTLTTSGGYAFDVCGNANNTFTVKNLTINSARFMYNEFSTVYIENCTINDSYGLCFSIAYPNGTNGVINIKDTTFNLNTTNNEPFAKIGAGTGRICDVTFNLENTKINMTTSKAADGGDNGRSCFNMLTGGVVTMNLDATSALTMNGQYMRTMFYGHDATGGLVLNLAEGAVIAINDCAANAPFITANMAGKTTINDMGADWVIGETAAAKGVTLPVFGTAGNTVIGYAKDGKLYKTIATVAGTYKASDFANVVEFSADDFDMIDGASLRTVYGESGIRFSMMISNDLMAALDSVGGYEFHMLIAPTANIGEGTLDADVLDVLDVKSTKIQTPGEINGAAYDNLRHVAVLMPDTAEAYTLELGARAYFTVTYADGSVATYYTEYDENNVRSMLDVAVALNATGEYDNNAAVQEIIAVCNANA